MKPELKHFFDSMEEYLAGPPGAEGLSKLSASHPGWDVAPERMALYGQFVRGHVRSTLEKLFPLTRKAVTPAAWDALVEGYTRTRPARHYELNRLGEGFPPFVADATQAQGLPPFLPSLARFEWTDFAVFASEEVIPERVTQLTPNPTLAVLEQPYRLCAFVRTRDGAPPAEGDELALLWRHPEALVTYYMAATPPALLVLKMAVEGLSEEAVAQATGMAAPDVHAEVVRFAKDGLVLRPVE
ncbi:DNA-binding domain-containing protein [Corallococcus sp. bb12-1]|uniref:HvfC/BufC N-terminal domain-containing protein n=1 Tax=Corallococcus sp. bb12-1 TaxID=2996784 RepID=UPI00226DB33A|nr:DNA-binding domain-containing protein [Corallococcus sp. bb12-1]MCY1045834.1 DNA-binding domain-containing protein [Corallococcus sp. bb12-1]